MDWDNLKNNSDQAKEKEYRIIELKKRWDELDIECTRNYLRFDVETQNAKDLLEEKALQGFKDFFQKKEFKLAGNASKLEATYNDVRFTLSTTEGYSFGLHFYIGNDLRDCKVFNLHIAKEFEGKYKQLLIQEIKDNSSIEFALEQIVNLEKNKSESEKMIADKETIKFTYELDKKYSGNEGQFDSIEEIIETIKDIFIK